MPPIRQLDDAFLAQLLDPSDDSYSNVLKVNITSDSLTSILTKLTSASNALQQELFKQVQDNFEDFSSLYNDSQDLHARVFDLVQSVSEAAAHVDNTKETVDKTVEAYQQLLRESRLNQSKIETLQQLEDILRIMETIETELEQCNYLDAVKHVTALIQVLEQPPDEATKTVIEFIQSRIDSLKQGLIGQLQEAIRAAIQYNPGSMRILTEFQINKNTVCISQVFQCLFQLGLLPKELMSIQRLIFKNILNHYFQDTYSVLQIDQVDVEGLGSGGVLQVIHHPTESQETRMDPVTMLQHMNSILGFFHRYMFSQTKDTLQIKQLFGNLILPDLFDTMISKSIAPAIPSSQQQLPGFDRVVNAVTHFESQCKSYGYFLHKDTSHLSAYVSNMDQHYAKKRRERILQEGRKVMIRRLYDTDMTQVQANGHTYHYQITQTPQILLVLVSDTLAEAVNLLDSHPISASSLVHGIQDLLDMYRAIMPSYHRPQYLSSAANALVFRNDCIWLSHQLIADIAAKSEAVGHFNHLVRDLEEAAQRLAELGQAWHELAMMQHVHMIQTVLDTLDGFTGMADNAKFQQDCDRAITRVIQCVLTFAKEIRPVVDETLFLDMLGRIVDSVLARLIHDIEELIDIGAEESHVIAVTLNSLAQLVGAFDMPGQDATESFVLDLVPSWQKFWLVNDILEMNMRDIMNSFRRGDLHMFEKSELVGLLCALFADTELREANIQEIKTGTMAASREPTVTMTAPREATPTSFGLTYTPDKDVEEAGWEDDENLFSNNSDVNNKTTSLSLALSPDHDMEQEAESGWNDDDDDDLFAQKSSFVPQEIDEQDSGWGDADEDVFVDNAMQQDSNIPETTLHQSSNVPTADPAKIDKVVLPNINKISATNSSEMTMTTALSAPALDEGDGWGWDEEDDDLFKEEQDLK